MATADRGGRLNATAQDVAIFLGVPPSTVYRAAAAGLLPHIRLGKHLRFDLIRVEQFLVEKQDRSTRD